MTQKKKKNKSIEDWPGPENLKDVQRFIGLYKLLWNIC